MSIVKVEGATGMPTSGARWSDVTWGRIMRVTAAVAAAVCVVSVVLLVTGVG
jgi:hypothetical protein